MNELLTKLFVHVLAGTSVTLDKLKTESEGNKKIYFVEDGDLYEAETSKKSKSLVKSDVIGIQKSLSGICYGTEEETIGFVF